jgi:hypothetical protein
LRHEFSPLGRLDTRRLRHGVFGVLQHLVHVDMHAIADASTVLGFPTVVDPRVERKVDGLGAVEAHVEARMVAFRVGDDELALSVD